MKECVEKDFLSLLIQLTGHINRIFMVPHLKRALGAYRHTDTHIHHISKHMHVHTHTQAHKHTHTHTHTHLSLIHI